MGSQIKAVFALILLTVVGGSAAAQSFSATLSLLDAAGNPTGSLGKVYVGDGKIRIETPELPNDFFVVDPSAKSAYLVRPRQHVYMEAKQSSPLTQLLVPVDPADPCLQWRMMAEVAGATGGEWQCTRLGDEILDAHERIKYQLVSPRGEINSVWIDPALKFISRIRDEKGGVEMRSVEQGPQPENLFEIPARYAKFNPLEMIERIKHSDVWVEQPK